MIQAMNPESPKAAPAPAQAPKPAPQPAPKNEAPKADLPKTDTPAPEVKPSAEPAKPARKTIADELDEIAGIKPKEEKKEESKKEPVKPEGELKDEPEKEGKPDEQPKQLGTAKELRTAYENQKRELESLKSELTKYKSGKVEDPEKKTLQERLSEEAKRREQIEVELRFANYERSEDYKEKFAKPIESAFEKAHKEVQSMVISNEDGSTFQATADHFNKLVMMNPQEAAKLAKQWFGDAAVEVLAHRRKILELNESRIQAVEKFKKESDEREKKMASEREEHNARVQQLWEQSINTHIEKNADYLKPVEGDEESNQLLDQGYKLADMAFSYDPNMPVEKRVALHAVVRNRAAAYDRLVHSNKSLKEKVEALEKELSEFKQSEPKSGEESVSVITNGQPQSWMEELDQLSGKRK